MNDFELREKEMNHLVSERRRAWNKLAVGMIITGAVLFVAGGIFGSIVGDKYEEKIDVMEADTQSEEYSAENIKDVNIDVGVGNVTLVKSADDKVHVNGTNVPNDYNVETSGGVLNIRVVNDNVGPFDWDDSMQLTIELPEKEISVGSTWTNTTSQENNGIEFEAEITYTVTAISKKSVDVNVSGIVKGQTEDVSGTYTGTASLNPQTGLLINSSIKQNLSMTISEQGMSIPITVVGTTTVEVK